MYLRRGARLRKRWSSTYTNSSVTSIQSSPLVMSCVGTSSTLTSSPCVPIASPIYVQQSLAEVAFRFITPVVVEFLVGLPDTLRSRLSSTHLDFITLSSLSLVNSNFHRRSKQPALEARVLLPHRQGREGRLRIPSSCKSEEHGPAKPYFMDW